MKIDNGKLKQQVKDLRELNTDLTDAQNLESTSTGRDTIDSNVDPK